MFPRRSATASAASAALAALALVLVASPALAKPVPVTPGWNPATPPDNPSLYELSFPYILYTVTCGGLTATGWSADVGEDPTFESALMTTSAVASACVQAPGSLVVSNGSETFEALPGNFDAAIGIGVVPVVPNVPRIDWDFVPMPRVGQWVGIDARTATGEPLPMLQRRIVSVGDDTFALDAPVGPEYLGAPVADNLARVLGMITHAGVEVTGMPTVCANLFACTNPNRVWWDITAPSKPRDVRAVGGKGTVTVTWKPVASTGGARVAYWYRVDEGRWTYAQKFRVAVEARKGATVTVRVQSVNKAGPGPIVTVSATAK